LYWKREVSICGVTFTSVPCIPLWMRSGFSSAAPPEPNRLT